MTPLGSSVIKQRVLERQRVRSYRTISRYVLNNANLNVVEDAATGALVELVSELLTERVVSEVQTAELDVPASWWQHLKQDHAPAWFVKRWPVVYTTWETRVTFQRYHTYPNADIDRPPTPLGRPIVFEQISKGDWSKV